MIPLRDSLRARRFPLVTVGIVALNVAAFLWEIGVGGVAWWAHIAGFLVGLVLSLLLGGWGGSEGEGRGRGKRGMPQGSQRRGR